MEGLPRLGSLLDRFQKNLEQLLKYKRRGGLAIALSGGVDSMALAWLLHESQHGSNKPRNLPQSWNAFMVNHRLRQESDQEVQQTSRRFEELTGFKPEIYEIDWVDHGGLPPRSRLETTARRLRYRVLGIACRDFRVGMLMTGHHADDQVETIISRLTQGATGFGLQGMQPYANLPECSDIWGVAETGARRLLPRQPQSGPGDEMFLALEHVLVGRPLLPFDKAELVHICRAVGLDWAEDKSNKDVKLTQRNAIRHLLETEQLPQALQKPSILRLGADRTDKKRALTKLVRRLHAATKRKYMMLDAGTISLELPDFTQVDYGEHSDLRGILPVAFIRDIVYAVSHKQEVGLQDVQYFASEILRMDKTYKNKTEVLENLQGGPSVKSVSTGAADVSAILVLEPKEHSYGQQLPPPEGQPEYTVTWRFWRNPVLLKKHNHLVMRLDSRGVLTNPDYPNYTKWDGRYWIKLKMREGPPIRKSSQIAQSQGNEVYSQGPSETHGEGNTKKEFVIRPLQIEDVIAMRQEVNRKIRRESNDVLSESAPHLARYKEMQSFGHMKDKVPVIPVIAEMYKGSIHGSWEDVIAIPSLGYFREDYAASVNCSVIYKSIGDAWHGLKSW